MIRSRVSGSFKSTLSALDRLTNGDIYRELDSYGRAGVAALQSATPVDTGVTANSWDYIIERDRKQTTITWVNTNTISPNGPPVALLLQYGHGTGTGGWVQGYDYINPSIRPVMDAIADDIWGAVTR